MSDFITFKAKNEKGVEFELSAKTAFLEKCPEPTKHNVFDLHSKFFLFKFLHNPNAPAVLRMNVPEEKWEDGSFYHNGHRTQYWVDGVYLNKETPEQAQKMHHNYLFSGKLMNELEKA